MRAHVFVGGVGEMHSCESVEVRFLFILELMFDNAITLGLRSFLQSISRLLRLATKPGRSELWQSVKICILGISLVGVIGFLIKLISMFMQAM